jgi:hypothetical protein
MRVVSSKPTISIRIHDNPIFVIDLHFEEYYTHRIEVTPTCAYFMEIPRLVDLIHADIPACIFLYSLKKGDSYNGFWTDR